MSGPRRRIAVIGAGVSGLTAAHLLQRIADVTLYEADDRLGGHAHTHAVPIGGRTYPVDSGFIVCNEYSYPRLLRLFGELGVETKPAEMSMSVRCDGCGLTYAGHRGPSGLLARPANAVAPGYLAMMAQIPAFYRRARALLEQSTSDGPEPTLGEFLAAGRYSVYFVRHFAVPLISAVWSCDPAMATEYPARYLFTFLANHGMLRVARSPAWRTVDGGSQRYVQAIAKNLHSVRAAASVRFVRRHDRGVVIGDGSGQVEFDAAVVATHADQALRLLADPTPDERAVLGAFAYSRNEVVLHCDDAILPDRAAARASWNYLLPACSPAGGPARISYDLNRLQRLGSPSPLVVTLNGGARVRPDRVIATMTYEHPIYTPRSVAAQRRLPDLNTRVTVFAGSYHGWGFHEDGCRSGIEAAARLGAIWPEAAP